jgi:hypothetical protein
MYKVINDENTSPCVYYLSNSWMLNEENGIAIIGNIKHLIFTGFVRSLQKKICISNIRWWMIRSSKNAATVER